MTSYATVILKSIAVNTSTSINFVPLMPILLTRWVIKYIGNICWLSIMCIKPRIFTLCAYIQYKNLTLIYGKWWVGVKIPSKTKEWKYACCFKYSTHQGQNIEHWWNDEWQDVPKESCSIQILSKRKPTWNVIICNLLVRWSQSAKVYTVHLEGVFRRMNYKRYATI